MPDLQECRISPRLAAVKNRSRLEFGMPPDHRTVAATLVNISREGALIVAQEPPALHEGTWVRMEVPAKTDWIAAVPVRLGELNEVGIRFVDPCPDDLLLAAMLGIDLGPTILKGPRPESVDDMESWSSRLHGRSRARPPGPA
jgi:hypothetical protein